MTYTKAQLYSWCEAHASEQLSLLKTLAAIPAPSHHEEKRAEFIRNWLLENGADHVTIDEAGNVVLPLNCLGNSLLVCMAHTDVVFPDMDSLPVREENGKLLAPGVGDDTANVVALMLCAKFFLTHRDLLTEPLLFVFNSCEEGLGNLKGVRQIMSDYAGKVGALVSFDLHWQQVITRAVGSERWRISFSTKGGHSFGDFGNESAIAHMAGLIDQLYRQEVPQKPGTKTTYNVGTISGGTSVNTIAQSAEMTYEYRSDDRECLAFMAEQFCTLVEKSCTEDVHISVEPIGNRPCGAEISAEAHTKLITRCQKAVQAVTGCLPEPCSGSTDANIPLSLGIPAATFGLYLGGGAHTREEYVEISSLNPGLKIALTFFLSNSLSD